MLHAISLCGFRNEFWFAKLMAWSFFFMGFFFFKAGYFNRSVGGDTLHYCWDKAKRLLLPYAVWGAIGSAIYFSFLWAYPDVFATLVRRLSWGHVYRMSHFYGNPPCWFLFSFFSCYIVMHFLDKWVEPSLWGKTAKAGSTIFVLACPFVSYYLWRAGNPLWMSLNNVFMGIFFFQLGRWWHLLEGRMQQGWLMGLSVALVLAFCYLNRHMHGEYDMSLNLWVQRPWGAGLNTALALCGLSGLLLTLHIPRIPILCYIGEHSMTFFVAHYPILFLYRFIRTLTGGVIFHSWWDYVAMLMLIFALCFLLVPVVERVPWLSGRWKKQASPQTEMQKVQA